MTTTLCSFCSSITLSALINGIRHPSVLPKTNCPLCALICERFSITSYTPPRRKLLLTTERLPSGTYHDLQICSARQRISLPLTATHPSCALSTRLLTSTADLPYALQILQQCEQSHPTPSLSPIPGTPNLRFIDTSSSPPRLVDLPLSTTSYVALSYVWGRDLPSHHKTFRSTLQLHLIALPTPLPKTYQDAIEVVKAFRMRYLWIDALCIVQDDAADKKTHIRRMQWVYSHARFTIAALVGGDVDAGLNLRRPERVVRDPIAIPGNEGLMIHPAGELVPSLNDVFVNAAWSKRGWTYQEAQLSPRMLCFMPEYWEFQCSGHTQLEDGWSNTRIRMDGLENRGDRVNIWVGVITEFMRRELTVEWDVLDALRGIETVVEEKYGVNFWWGLCDANVSMELFWTSVRGRLVKRCVEEGAPPPPSWSWVGWKGEVSCDSALYMARVEAEVKVMENEMRWVSVNSRVGMESRFVEHRNWGPDVVETEVFSSEVYSMIFVNVKEGIRVIVVGGEDVGWCAFDEEVMEEQCHEVECVVISQSEEGETWNVLLVLRDCENLTRGKRVGIGEIKIQGWEAVPMTKRQFRTILLE